MYFNITLDETWTLIKEITYTEGVLKQDAEENIWNQEGEVTGG
jgi:hypothetical protein